MSQHAFAFKYGSKFGGKDEVQSEKKTKSSTALFQIKTVVKACEVFNSATISTFNSAGDVVIVTPWRYLARDMTIELHDNGLCDFEKGKLAIPVRDHSDSVEIFLACAGLDENDDVPFWARDVRSEKCCEFYRGERKKM